MDFWFAEQQARLRMLPDTKRSLYEKIDWAQRCIGIVGARGTGKTTLVLQYLQEHYATSEKALYISIDHPKFQSLSLYEFGEEFFQYGGELLVLDEVHKYQDWSSHIKTLYDSYPKLKMIFSGSSLLKLQKQNADLSRRAVMYHLPGLSFREYLLFEAQEMFMPLTFQELMEQHREIATVVAKRLRPLEYFQNYLKYGYYPFFLEGKDIYRVRLQEVVNQILEGDLPYVNRVDLRQISKLKKLLYMLSVTVPSELNIQKISSATEISRPKVYEYLEYLKDARLLNMVRGVGKGYRVLTKPEKIYLENTNLTYAIADTVNIGTLRETFFVNQIHNAYSSHSAFVTNAIELSKQGDFVVNGQYTVEVGGKNKGVRQIQNVEHACIAADGIECGVGKKIPLWLFGFLY